jgi:formate hydrogenlyase subunit 6/NADH:ubiquinone oxidoreductase subunit I
MSLMNKGQLRDKAVPSSVTFKISDECIGCGACARGCPENAIKGAIKVRFDIDPFRCIACGTCFTTCPTGAIIDAQGNRSPRKGKKKKKVAKSWIDPALCAGCKTCSLNCPQKAIIVINKGLFSRECCRVDEKRCIGCGICTRYCIIGAVELRSGKKSGDR